MANERDLDRLLREKLSRVQRLAERKLISGYRNNAGDIVLRDSASPQGTFYARTVQDSRDKVVIYGNCSVVNVPFVAEYDGNGNLVYKYQDTEIADLQTQGTATTIFAPPAIPNLSQINVGDYQFAPLRVNFDTSGGLSVAVGAGWHVNDYFASGTIDLTSNVPATPGEVRWVVVGIDTTTNLLTAINGTPITGTQSDLVVEDIADIVIPTGVMPLGAVALANGQTAIAQGTSWIVDIRRHHAIGGAGYYETVEDNGTPETQRAALNFEDNATGAINFVLTDDAGNDRTDVQAELDIEGLAEDSTPDPTAFVVISDGGVLAKTALSDLPSSGSISVTDGTTTVDPATALNLDGAFFDVTNGGGGTADVTLTSSGSAGSKQRFLPTVLYDNTLGAAGDWEIANADLIAGVGDFADYEYLELRVYNLRSDVAATTDTMYLLAGTGGTLDTTTTNYAGQLVSGANSTVASSRFDNPGVATILGNSGVLADSYMDFVITVYNPASSDFKTALCISGQRSASTTSAILTLWWQWENTGVIDVLALRTDNSPTDEFVAGSRLQILGYKRELIGGAEYSTANVSNPPTDAEIDSAFGSPASAGVPFIGVIDDNGADTNVYLVVSNGTSWWYTALTKAT